MVSLLLLLAMCYVLISCSRYHGKCLKIARGKVKEDDKYTCPICDYRVKIPRDAARPKLEDLMQWEQEIAELPFQPDEQDCLRRIIAVATQFREFIRPYTQAGMGLTSAEIPIMRFYLRKIEGAETLLVQETNFFRAELHRWMPIAPIAPEALSSSLSTRKPRPTKQQKLMMSLGIENPADLPVNLRTKAHVFKKKSITIDGLKTPMAIKPAPQRESPTTGSQSPQLAAISQPAFDYSPQFSIGSQVSPTFTRVSPSISSPVLGHHSMIRGSGMDAMLYNAAPPTYSHGLPSAPAVNASPPFSSVNLSRDMNSMFAFDDLAPSNDSSDIYLKDSVPPPPVISQAEYEQQAAQAEDVARAQAQQAAAEALTLQQFSTIGDDDRDVDLEPSIVDE